MLLPLLTPESVRSDSTRGEREARHRMRTMTEEEDRLVKSINMLHAEEIAEKNRIREDVASFRNEAHTEITALDVEISNRRSEVTQLEERKRVALEPTIKREQAVSTVEKTLQERIVKNDVRERNLKMSEEVHIAALEQLRDDQQIVKEETENIAARERAVSAEEDRLKVSEARLADKWVELHTTIDIKNAEMQERESKVAAGERANVEYKATLDAREVDYQRKDREIADRYATLQSASEEIKGKQSQ